MMGIVSDNQQEQYVANLKAEIARLRTDRNEVIRECMACVDREYYHEGRNHLYSTRQALSAISAAMTDLIEDD